MKLQMTSMSCWMYPFWIGSTVLLAGSIYVLAMPDKWDRAVAIKVCDGLPVVRLEDGTAWLRYRWRYYLAEDWTRVC